MKELLSKTKQYKPTAPVAELIKLLERHCDDIQLVSYGLAPNPNGFCYEVLNPDKITLTDMTRIVYLLNTLTTKEENEIRELYL